MSIIIFPGLNLKFNISRIAFSINSIYIYWCARIYYVLFDLKYYIKEPLQIFNLRNGGLAIYGGIIGGAVTCYIYCKKKKINILDLLDFIAPCLALRTSNREMGQLCKHRGIWNAN